MSSVTSQNLVVRLVLRTEIDTAALQDETALVSCRHAVFSRCCMALWEGRGTVTFGEFGGL